MTEPANTGEQQQQSTIGTVAVKQDLDATLEAIRSSHEFPEQGKRELATQAFDEAAKRYQQAIQRAETGAAERVTQAERDLFRVTGAHSAYRAAFDRAHAAVFLAESAEQKEQELGRMLERAEKTGDEVQADAIFQLAVEDGLESVGDAYLKSRPDKAQKVARLTQALEDQQRVRDEIAWARAFPLKRPPEYDGRLSDKERIRPSDRISRAYSGGSQ
jgi:hypothetical protein